MHEASYTIEAVARTLVYVPAILLIGAVTYRLRYADPASRSLARFALAAAISLTAAVIFRALAHTYAAFGEDAYSWESIRLVAVESRWGSRWRWQLIAAIAATISLSLALARVKLGWMLATLAAVGLCASLPLTGHAMVLGTTALGVQAGHVAGAGVWIGTLFVLWLYGDAESSYRRFAAVASTGATLVVVSGAYTAWHALPSVSSIWQTDYGRILLLKLLLVGFVMGCGFYNWRHFRLARGLGQAWIRRELAFAFLVLAVTGWLGETGMP